MQFSSIKPVIYAQTFQLLDGLRNQRLESQITLVFDSANTIANMKDRSVPHSGIFDTLESKLDIF